MSAAYINYGDLPIATENFHCGEPSLDEFIKEHAQTFIQKGLSAVSLLIEVETRELIGFYAISPFAIDGRVLRSVAPGIRFFRFSYVQPKQIWNHIIIYWIEVFYEICFAIQENVTSLVSGHGK